jgi:hypothetical protein
VSKDSEFARESDGHRILINPFAITLRRSQTCGSLKVEFSFLKSNLMAPAGHPPISSSWLTIPP